MHLPGDQGLSAPDHSAPPGGAARPGVDSDDSANDQIGQPVPVYVDIAPFSTENPIQVNAEKSITRRIMWFRSFFLPRFRSDSDPGTTDPEPDRPKVALP